MDMLKIFFTIFCLLTNSALAVKHLKLNYEKDVSEHCRRRVVPSIFLGRQVVEANARILQLSRLELPYSCYISIRTESGSSMVMMIQVTSHEVREACKNSAQLLVYEMGETFGGYWGPLPETVLRRDPPPPKAYTLGTTPSTKTIRSTQQEEEHETATTRSAKLIMSSDHSSESSMGDYVEVEVPLINVSIHMIPSKEIQTEISDTADGFDANNDVTPIVGGSYETSMLPLVQFQLVEGGRRNYDGDGEPPKYDLDIAQEFTPDLRLTLPQLNPMTSKRRSRTRYQTTRRLNFKKHRTLFHSQRYSDRYSYVRGKHISYHHHFIKRMLTFEAITRKMNEATKYYFPTTRNLTRDKSKYTQDSWEVIEDLIKKLNRTKSKMSKTTLSMKEANLLDNISDMDHNNSVYLTSNLSIYSKIGNTDINEYTTTEEASLSTRTPLQLISDVTKEYTTEEPASSQQTEATLSEIAEGTVAAENDPYFDEKSSSTKLNTQSILTTELHITAFATNVTENTTHTNDVFGKNVSETQSNIPTEIIKTTSEPTSLPNLAASKKKENLIATGTMVGHESWENLVQAAPEMAVLLNRTVADVSSLKNTNDDITKEINEAPHKNKMSKRKRDIHSIAIENAQPHRVSTRRTKPTTTEVSFDIADMQEFAQLVELQDDELHGRIALRHLNHFVGPPLFNLCNVSDPTKPHVHLFNSSRIVLSPSNFTLERMVIILTAARALLTGELRCPKSKIECQVSGSRVCLDSMVACDSVPNCGSYDIYDEDRLMCGHTDSLQHNVYLAAFTFLAVMLTLIYAVHYWLKRCVPDVADAFFVYSDGVENVLYLDTIMRSPHDMGEEPKMVYHSHMYGGEIYDEAAAPRKSFLQFLRYICCCCCRKTHSAEKKSSLTLMDPSMPKRLYSFTELEIQKMIASSKDTAVQTGDSIELSSLKQVKDNKTVPLSDKRPRRTTAASIDFTVKPTDSLLTLEEPLPEDYTDELSILKFLKADRTKRNSSLDNILMEPVGPPPKNSQAAKKAQFQDSQSRTETPSEKEIEIHSYDRPALLEPGPSGTSFLNKDDNVPSLGSVNKHLRFDDVTTAIPPGRYTDEDDDIRSQPEGRKMVVLGEKKRRSSRLLDTIDETDEQGAKEHRYFWPSKGKNPKKKSHNLSLR